MNNRLRIQKKAFSQSNATPPSNLFQSRPFWAPEVASPTPQEIPDLQQQQERATGKGFNVLEIPNLVAATSPPLESPQGLRLQAKLTIGEPGDRYEQEADTVASQVVQRINVPQSQTVQRDEMIHQDELQVQPQVNFLQREEIPEAQEELRMMPQFGILQRQEMPQEDEIQTNPLLQRKSDTGEMDASPDLEASIQQAKGGGQPLSDNIRGPMEQAFGANFSGVKVHTDTTSDQLNQSIQAKAFTAGQDVFFRQGAYDPGSRGGQELIAHELTHVVQQTGGTVQRSPLPATGQAEVKPRRASFHGHVEKGGVIIPYTQPMIQRAISWHQIQDANNQNPQGGNPAQTRQAWLKGLLQQELTRIIQPLPNQRLGQALETLEQKNSTAYWIVKDELLPYLQPNSTIINYANSLTKEDILTINEILNRLEQEVGMQAAAPKEIANVLVGNEFTFTNSSLENLEANNKDDLHEKMLKPYNTVAESWKAAMSNHRIAPYQEYKADNMLHLTYKFESAQHGLDWEYRVTPDQKCVEIITGKAKAEDLYTGHIANLIDNYIFGIANSIGLEAHGTIGGGHINIDEKTAFGSYQANDPESAKRAAKVLASFIQEFYKDASYWESIDPDTANSAFPKDLQYKVGTGKDTKTKTKQADFEELIQKFNQEGWRVEKLADELMDKVFDQNLVDASKKESPHYQALNVEHLGSKETGNTRRLEVRRVSAQPNRQALIEQLNRIAGMLKTARGAVQ